VHCHNRREKEQVVEDCKLRIPLGIVPVDSQGNQVKPGIDLMGVVGSWVSREMGSFLWFHPMDCLERRVVAVLLS